MRKWKYQLVLQFLCDSIEDYDAMIELEDAIIENIGSLGDVDGHDTGSGEMNVFIHTNKPDLVFEELKPVLILKNFYPNMKAAYREFDSDDYTILHPPGSTEFHVV